MFLSQKRMIIVHFHIFKNAGSTVDSIFRRNFPKSFYSLDNRDAASFISPEAGMEYILKNRRLRVLTSHQLVYPLPEHKGLLIFPIFFLRHPVDRISSIYRYQRTQESYISPESQIAKQQDFKGYLLWLLEKGQGRSGGIRNFQTWKLSRFENAHKYSLTEQDLIIVKERFANSPFFGIVERFEDSLTLMKQFLHNDFPKIDYSYQIQNRSSNTDNLQISLDSMKEQLGFDLYQQLFDINYFDIELYQHALKLFEDRLNP